MMNSNIGSFENSKKSPGVVKACVCVSNNLPKISRLSLGYPETLMNGNSVMHKLKNPL